MTWCDRLFVPVCIGTLLGVGFVYPALWWVVFGGVAWLYYCLPRWYQAGWLPARVWLVWTVKALWVLSFFWTVYPITWLGFSLGRFELGLVGLYWGTVALWVGMGGLVLAWLYRLAVRRLPAWGVVTIFPLLYLAAELAGALAFSVMTYGPGGSVTIAYSYGMVGYLAAHHSWLLPVAQVAGVCGTTVLLVSLALLFWYWWQHRSWLLVVALAVLFGTAGLSVQAPAPGQTPTHIVATVTTTFPNEWWFSPAGQRRIAAEQLAALQAAVAADATHIVFPEDSRLVPQLSSAARQRFLKQTLSDTSVVLVDSGRTQVAGQTVLQSVVYDAGTAQLFQSQKRILVPQGEFMPYLYGALLRVAGQGTAASFLNQQLAYRVGDDVSQADFTARVPSVLFCFESNHPFGVRRLMSERAGQLPFIAHVVSHGWFHDSVVLQQQLVAMLQLQAVWNDTYIVVAGNQAPSYTVTPQGAIVLPREVARGEHWSVGVTAVPARSARPPAAQ